MATNTVLDKIATEANFTITLASLASSTSGVGRQSTLLTNASPAHMGVIIHVKVKQGTSPTSNRAVYVYFIRSDGTLRDDSAGASDAGLTVKNLQPIMTLWNGASAATGDVLQGSVYVEHPGTEWGIAIVHDTAVNLDSTEGNHGYSYEYVDPDVAAAA
jgi:hypothetical protein